jgi:hypothetical protein
MAQLPVIDFAWARDPKGYRLVDSELSTRIVRNGPNRSDIPCRPLSGEEFRIFARTAYTSNGALEFVQSFGPLTWSGADATQGDLVALITMNADAMRQLLNSAAQGREPDARGGIPRIITLRVTMVWDPTTKSLRWSFSPDTLLDALWVQFGQAVTRGAQIRSCQHCGAWFEAGIGTGRRADAKFCTDEHRIAFNSLKRSKGK